MAISTINCSALPKGQKKNYVWLPYRLKHHHMLPKGNISVRNFFFYKNAKSKRGFRRRLALCFGISAERSFYFEIDTPNKQPIFILWAIGENIAVLDPIEIKVFHKF